MGKLSPLANRSAHDPNRHSGVFSKDCRCGLVHDDELKSVRAQREQAVELLGGKCANPNCRWMNEDGTLGCTDRRVLQLDHVNDDGFMERKTAAQRAGYYTRILYAIKNGSNRYQLLCANCNWLKRVTTGAWAIEFTKNTKQRARWGDSEI